LKATPAAFHQPHVQATAASVPAAPASQPTKANVAKASNQRIPKAQRVGFVREPGGCNETARLPEQQPLPPAATTLLRKASVRWLVRNRAGTRSCQKAAVAVHTLPSNVHASANQQTR
jgi:hypothetical protein